MKKMMRRQEQGIPWINLLIYLLCSYIVTAVILMLLALLLYKMNLSEKVIHMSIIITYVAASFLGGFLAGKKMKQKKYLWGLFMGLAYYIVLFLISLAVNQSFTEVADSVFTALILCAGGGMLGGMLS